MHLMFVSLPLVANLYRRHPGSLAQAVAHTTEAMGMPVAERARGELELHSVVSEYIFLEGNMIASQVRNLLLALILYMTNNNVRNVRQLARKSFV